MEGNYSNMNMTDINCPDEESQNYFAVITFFSCFLNILLFWLVRRKTHPLMKPYIKILYSSTILDFLSALLQFSTQARPEVLGDRNLLTFTMDGFLPSLVQNWPIFKGGNFNYILIPEYFACYSIIIYTIVPFFFRYLIICHNYHMGNWLFTLLLTIVLGFALQTAIVINYISDIVYETNIRYVPIPNPNCTRFLPQIDPELNFNNPHVKLMFTVWHYFDMSYEYSFGLVAFFAFRVYWFLRKQAKLISTENNNIQWQISLTLGFQTLTPFLIYFGPLFMLHILGLFGFDELMIFNIMFKINFISYSLIPLVNPFVSICMIKSYRRAILDIFLSVYKMVGMEGSSVHPSQTNPADLSKSVTIL